MRTSRTILLLLLFAAGCGDEEDPPAPHGRAIYRQSTCVQCHGPDRKGTRQGPPLTGLREHWTEAGLVRYLRNPAAYVDFDPRLAALKARYAQLMPKFVMEEETRAALARYLLQSDAP